MKKTICLDFDGVIHSYKSGWQGADKIPDEPVPGAMQFIIDVLESEMFIISILSARSHQDGGIEAMKKYIKNQLELVADNADKYMSQISFSEHKPHAHLYIDDRGFCFKGDFPTLDFLNNFKVWYKKNY